MFRMWRIIGTWLFRSIVSLPRWWRHEYRDFSIIIEQDGRLRYFNTPAKFQRIAVRSAIAVFSASAVSIIALGITSLALNSTKARLEKSHQDIYATLLADSTLDEADCNELDMLELAKEIKERQMAIQQYIGLSAKAFSDENRSLLSQLQATDLSNRAIQIIEHASLGGGGGIQPSSEGILPNHQNLLPESLVSEILKNRDLHGILRALPNQMPLKQYEVSSDFGIRRHPITRVVHFHNGVDLVVHGADRYVYPAKPGKVLSAEYHPQLGNTVVLQHSHNLTTLYGHLKDVRVKEGDDVHLETKLGAIGNTGASTTGTHLHFEVLVGGFATNPIKVIRAAKNVQQIN